MQACNLLGHSFLLHHRPVQAFRGKEKDQEENLDVLPDHSGLGCNG